MYPSSIDKFPVPKLIRNASRIQWDGSQGLKYARNAGFERRSSKKTSLDTVRAVFGLIFDRFEYF